MMFRLLGVLAATLALAATPLHAAPTGAAPVDSVTYHIERHNHLVIVKNADGKTLASFSTATPNLQGVLTKDVPKSGLASTNEKAPHQLMLTMEDQTGNRLWSTVVPVMSPHQINVGFSADVVGTQLVIAHQSVDTSDPNQPSPSRLTFVVGPDGRPVSMSDGHKTYNLAFSPTSAALTGSDGQVLIKAQANPNNDGAVFTGPDGMVGSVKTTDTGTTIDLNGVKFEVKQVTKDGKTYSSFPWNGHNVLVEQPNTVSFTSDGDLTVNLPSTDKTTASK